MEERWENIFAVQEKLEKSFISRCENIWFIFAKSLTREGTLEASILYFIHLLYCVCMCGDASATGHTYGGQLQELVLCFPLYESLGQNRISEPWFLLLVVVCFCCCLEQGLTVYGTGSHLVYGTGSHRLAPAGLELPT